MCLLKESKQVLSCFCSHKVRPFYQNRFKELICMKIHQIHQNTPKRNLKKCRMMVDDIDFFPPSISLPTSWRKEYPPWPPPRGHGSAAPQRPLHRQRRFGSLAESTPGAQGARGPLGVSWPWEGRWAKKMEKWKGSTCVDMFETQLGSFEGVKFTKTCKR